MKRTGFKWVIVLLLTIIAVAILLRNRWSTTGNDFYSLLPDENMEVDQITLIHKSDSLVFVRENEEWKHEDELLQADAIKNLLVASRELSLKSIVPLEQLGAFSYLLEIQFLPSYLLHRSAGHVYQNQNHLDWS